MPHNGALNMPISHTVQKLLLLTRNLEYKTHCFEEDRFHIHCVLVAVATGSCKRCCIEHATPVAGGKFSTIVDVDMHYTYACSCSHMCVPLSSSIHAFRYRLKRLEEVELPCLALHSCLYGTDDSFLHLTSLVLFCT